MECVFCDIVAGRARASIVCEDATTMAFVDRRQPSWPHGGHILVVPKPHVEFLYDLPDELSAAVMRTVVRVSGSLRTTVAAEGISVWSSNGPGADQEVPHVHLHVMARYAEDGVLRIYRDRPHYPSPDELDALAGLLSRPIR
ncbi:HIT family protein [Microlunatus parietis]|uniref:Histidine triad (HIT) family protein n=1 Tax=Microlunatus parietis TaxID=682979 RepID=A0A7Y9LE24_9ACTN|nr:HIT domain-containing protein [Microlunatus parietis]NYE72601.1 histidine triad (HIT) family protein [Microlunatus parietis]